MRRETLCLTLTGANCDILTISNKEGLNNDFSNKKGVILTARVHPGETVASFMMKGQTNTNISS